MYVEPGMLLEPCLDACVLVRGIVIADQVQVFVFGRFPINLAQELEPSRVATGIG